MHHQPTRRNFLKSSAVATVMAVWRATAAEDLREPEALANGREKAKQRHRRLIYNDDGCGPLGSPEGGTPDGFLYGKRGRMGALRGTQVDSVFMCSGVTHVLNHRSSVAESYADVAQRYRIGGEWEA